MTSATTVRRTVVALVAVLGVTANACSTASQRATPVPFVPVDPGSASATDRATAAAQQRLRVHGDDDEARLELAQAFLQKAREVADPTLYTKARGLLDALSKRRRDLPVLVAAGTLALAQHRFADARRLGQDAVRLSPANEAALGVLVDADNELGRYDEALEATQRMVDARPNLASLSRVSYARELRGDLPGAVEAMGQAATAAGGADGENLAYVQVLLGNLLLTTGDLTGADSAYAAAERSFPGFAAARAGRARLLVARGRPGEAADVLAEVLRRQPLAEYAIAQGDDLAAAGRQAEAARAYDLVRTIARLYAANGVNVDLELALFDADHAPGEAVVKKARAALATRPGTLGHDVLAWSLFRTGRMREAATESALALRLGSEDPQERFHAAAIAMATGRRQAAAEHLAMVLRTNPRFSAAYASRVEALATELGLTVPPPAG